MECRDTLLDGRLAATDAMDAESAPVIAVESARVPRGDAHRGEIDGVAGDRREPHWARAPRLKPIEA